MAANLSQEQLAEAASISTSAIGAYERGVRTVPHRETVALLAAALGLNGADLTEFTIAARSGRPAVAKTEPSSRKDNLPAETTSIVGRETELAEIAALLQRHRVVTLTGSGGIGKTRAALSVASRFCSRPDGVWFVDLSAMSDGDLTVSNIAAAVNEPAISQLDRFVERIKGRDMLIVLDNCEHLLESVCEIALTIIRNCPKVSLLATSREPLRLTAEAVYGIPVLPVPAGTAGSVEDALGFAGIELFVRRAEMADRAFRFDDDTLQAVVDICRRLDGIPLAIELAASCLPLLGIAELQRQLAVHLTSLSSRHRDVPTRQRTLRSTLTWSYKLLEERDQVLFRRLGIFAGGWTLEAAQRVVSDEAFSAVAVYEGLCSLVERSMVGLDATVTPARYRMLEINRAFAAEEAVQAGDFDVVADLHAEWLAAVADEAYAATMNVPRDRWHATYDRENENARSALRWCIGRGQQPLLASKILAGLRPLWTDRGLISEFHRFIRDALPMIDTSTYPGAAAHLLLALTNGQVARDRLATAERAIALFKKTDDLVGLASALVRVAVAYRQTGRIDDAEHALDQAGRLYTESGLESSLPMINTMLQRATIHVLSGRTDKARTDLSRVQESAKVLDERFFLMSAHILLAEIEFQVGDILAALGHAETALIIARRLSYSQVEMGLYANQACYWLAANDLAEARNNAEAALEHVRVDHPEFAWLPIQHFAAIAALSNKPRLAGRLRGFCDEQLSVAHWTREPTEQIGYDILMHSLNGQLSRLMIDELSAQGAALTHEQAIREAVEERAGDRDR